MNDSPPKTMKVEAVDVEAERRRKRIVTSVLATTAVVVLAGGGVLAWLLTPPPLPTTPEEAMAVVKSHRFAMLSDEGKQPYYDVIREQFGMDREMRRVWREDEELRDASRDIFRQMMAERMDAYMLAGPEERAEMMENSPWGRGRGGGEGRGGEGGRPGGGDANRGRERVSDRLANGSAQRGAAMGEWVQDRRRQREQQN